MIPARMTISYKCFALSGAFPYKIRMVKAKYAKKDNWMNGEIKNPSNSVRRLLSLAVITLSSTTSLVSKELEDSGEGGEVLTCMDNTMYRKIMMIAADNWAERA